ncbi:unnamed protein product [Lymnaea stagnalis]|uniref:Uncharacterized protein n=1 Tax=Lymnaea stagnalis TaxID=6523 RepID=A0AAV2HCC7_LYMST
MAASNTPRTHTRKRMPPEQTVYTDASPQTPFPLRHISPHGSTTSSRQHVLKCLQSSSDISVTRPCVNWVPLISPGESPTEAANDIANSALNCCNSSLLPSDSVSPEQQRSREPQSGGLKELNKSSSSKVMEGNKKTGQIQESQFSATESFTVNEKRPHVPMDRLFSTNDSDIGGRVLSVSDWNRQTTHQVDEPKLQANHNSIRMGDGEGKSIHGQSSEYSDDKVPGPEDPSDTSSRPDVKKYSQISISQHSSQIRAIVASQELKHRITSAAEKALEDFVNRSQLSSRSDLSTQLLPRLASASIVTVGKSSHTTSIALTAVEPLQQINLRKKYCRKKYSKKVSKKRAISVDSTATLHNTHSRNVTDSLIFSASQLGHSSWSHPSSSSLTLVTGTSTHDENSSNHPPTTEKTKPKRKSRERKVQGRIRSINKSRRDETKIDVSTHEIASKTCSELSNSLGSGSGPRGHSVKYKPSMMTSFASSKSSCPESSATTLSSRQLEQNSSSLESLRGSASKRSEMPEIPKVISENDAMLSNTAINNLELISTVPEGVFDSPSKQSYPRQSSFHNKHSINEYQMNDRTITSSSIETSTHLYTKSSGDKYGTEDKTVTRYYSAHSVLRRSAVNKSGLRYCGSKLYRIRKGVEHTALHNGPSSPKSKVIKSCSCPFNTLTTPEYIEQFVSTASHQSRGSLFRFLQTRQNWYPNVVNWLQSLFGGKSAEKKDCGCTSDELRDITKKLSNPDLKSHGSHEIKEAPQKHVKTKSKRMIVYNDSDPFLCVEGMASTLPGSDSKLIIDRTVCMICPPDDDEECGPCPLQLAAPECRSDDKKLESPDTKEHSPKTINVKSSLSKESEDKRLSRKRSKISCKEVLSHSDARSPERSKQKFLKSIEDVRNNESRERRKSSRKDLKIVCNPCVICKCPDACMKDKKSITETEKYQVKSLENNRFSIEPLIDLTQVPEEGVTHSEEPELGMVHIVEPEEVMTFNDDVMALNENIFAMNDDIMATLQDMEDGNYEECHSLICPEEPLATIHENQDEGQSAKLDPSSATLICESTLSAVEQPEQSLVSDESGGLLQQLPLANILAQTASAAGAALMSTVEAIAAKNTEVKFQFPQRRGLYEPPKAYPMWLYPEHIRKLLIFFGRDPDANASPTKAGVDNMPSDTSIADDHLKLVDMKDNLQDGGDNEHQESAKACWGPPTPPPKPPEPERIPRCVDNFRELRFCNPAVPLPKLCNHYRLINFRCAIRPSRSTTPRSLLRSFSPCRFHGRYHVDKYGIPLSPATRLTRCSRRPTNTCHRKMICRKVPTCPSEPRRVTCAGGVKVMCHPDVWGNSELKRSPCILNEKGDRYYYKNLFKKRLNMKNFLKNMRKNGSFSSEVHSEEPLKVEVISCPMPKNDSSIHSSCQPLAEGKVNTFRHPCGSPCTFLRSCGAGPVAEKDESKNKPDPCCEDSICDTCDPPKGEDEKLSTGDKASVTGHPLNKPPMHPEKSKEENPGEPKSRLSNLVQKTLENSTLMKGKPNGESNASKAGPSPCGESVRNMCKIQSMLELIRKKERMSSLIKDLTAQTLASRATFDALYSSKWQFQPDRTRLKKKYLDKNSRYAYDFCNAHPEKMRQPSLVRLGSSAYSAKSNSSRLPWYTVRRYSYARNESNFNKSSAFLNLPPSIPEDFNLICNRTLDEDFKSTGNRKKESDFTSIGNRKLDEELPLRVNSSQAGYRVYHARDVYSHTNSFKSHANKWTTGTERYYDGKLMTQLLSSSFTKSMNSPHGNIHLGNDFSGTVPLQHAEPSLLANSYTEQVYKTFVPDYSKINMEPYNLQTTAKGTTTHAIELLNAARGKQLAPFAEDPGHGAHTTISFTHNY